MKKVLGVVFLISCAQSKTIDLEDMCDDKCRDIALAYNKEDVQGGLEIDDETQEISCKCSDGLNFFTRLPLKKGKFKEVKRRIP